MLALRSASRLALEAVLLANDPGRYRGLADTGATVVPCDTNSLDSLRAVLDGFGSDEVAAITTTSEFYLPLAARLAADLGLPGADPAAVAKCRDKASTRHALAAAGVDQPRFAVVRDPAEVADAVNLVGLPCVVKPSDDTGSNNVLTCHTVADALGQVARILAEKTNVRGQATSGEALVEEYVDAEEFSVEMLGHAGSTQCIGITQKSVRNAPHFVEHRHVYPADLDRATARRVADTVRAALDAVGVRHGLTHTEVRVLPDRVAILEINARLAGGMIPTLVRLVDGIDLLDQQLACALGREPTITARRDGYASIQFLTAPYVGELIEVTGVEQAKSMPGVFDVTVTALPGRQVRPARNAYDRLGYVIATGSDVSSVVARVQAAADAINFHLVADPVPAETLLACTGARDGTA